MKTPSWNTIGLITYSLVLVAIIILVNIKILHVYLKATNGPSVVIQVNGDKTSVGLGVTHGGKVYYVPMVRIPTKCRQF